MVNMALLRFFVMSIRVTKFARFIWTVLSSPRSGFFTRLPGEWAGETVQLFTLAILAFLVSHETF